MKLTVFLLLLCKVMYAPERACRRLKTTELTRCKLGVVHLPVVGAAPLVQPRVRRRAAVAQRAGAAAHGGVHGVQVLRTLEALMIVPIRVQPAVAVLPLRVRYPQIPGQISEQQAVQQAHHPGERSPLVGLNGSLRPAGASGVGRSGLEAPHWGETYWLEWMEPKLWESCVTVISPHHHPLRLEPQVAKLKTNW